MGDEREKEIWKYHGIYTSSSGIEFPNPSLIHNTRMPTPSHTPSQIQANYTTVYPTNSPSYSYINHAQSNSPLHSPPHLPQKDCSYSSYDLGSKGLSSDSTTPLPDSQHPHLAAHPPPPLSNESLTQYSFSSYSDSSVLSPTIVGARAHGGIHRMWGRRWERRVRKGGSLRRGERWCLEGREVWRGILQRWR